MRSFKKRLGKDNSNWV